MRGKFGKFINSLKVDYLYQKFNKSDHASDDIANMLDDFENRKKTSFTTLSDVPINEYLQSCKSNKESGASNSMTIQTTQKRYGSVINKPIQEDDQNLSLTSLQKLLKKKEKDNSLAQPKYCS